MTEKQLTSKQGRGCYIVQHTLVFVEVLEVDTLSHGGCRIIVEGGPHGDDETQTILAWLEGEVSYGRGDGFPVEGCGNVELGSGREGR